MTLRILIPISIFILGIVFYAIGEYADKRQHPMWFIIGGYIPDNKITDIREFNRENAKMWRNYSFLFFSSGLLYFYEDALGLLVLALACTVGIAWLFWKHNQIMKKYKYEPPKAYPKKKKKKR